GKRRRTLEESEASLQASAADLENVRLVVAAEIAGDYFALEQLDSELDVLDRTVRTLERGLQLVQARHDGGIASGLDGARDETLPRPPRPRATLRPRDRAAVEHALAELTGQTASGSHAATRRLTADSPALDLGLPSDLLERRPDVAEAERQVAVANAQVG